MKDERPPLPYNEDHRMEDLANFNPPFDVIVFKYGGDEQWDYTGTYFRRWHGDDIKVDDFDSDAEFLYWMKVEYAAALEPKSRVTVYGPVDEDWDD